MAIVNKVSKTARLTIPKTNIESEKIAIGTRTENKSIGLIGKVVENGSTHIINRPSKARDNNEDTKKNNFFPLILITIFISITENLKRT